MTYPQPLVIITMHTQVNKKGSRRIRHEDEEDGGLGSSPRYCKKRLFMPTAPPPPTRHHHKVLHMACYSMKIIIKKLIRLWGILSYDKEVTQCYHLTIYYNNLVMKKLW
jgi:hypothetical protein